ncbi:hypothetical protein F4560_006336 [Saccharothrix ecbatanensis]|uniref:Uncharacterized protein n=1 Tax=Saccharothrix ecbatanensis TaxID=1105145 RepID=A0A7W9HQH7_9PSEU|nr:hypothetical protein [Saccharothrix ecbatanensis]MBB5806568.1 hypothetical protein [Saccharothrix ecbatanensis]
MKLPVAGSPGDGEDPVAGGRGGAQAAEQRADLAATRLLAVSMTETESLRVIVAMAEAMEGRADGRNAVEEVD